MGVAAARCRDLSTIKKKGERKKFALHVLECVRDFRDWSHVGEREEQLDRINYVQYGPAYNIDRTAWTSMNSIIPRMQARVRKWNRPGATFMNENSVSEEESPR